MESDCPLSVGQKAKEEKPKSLEWQGTNRNRLKNWCARLCPMQVASRDLLAWDETPFFKKAIGTIQDFLFGLRVKPDGCYLFFHGLRTPREEITFTSQPKIQSQIFRYGRSIFCLPHRPNFSDIFDLCSHWVSVVRALRKPMYLLKSSNDSSSKSAKIWLWKWIF